MPRIAEQGAHARGRRRAALVGVPIIVAAALALAALWRVGVPPGGEPGAAGTIGLNPDRTATLERVEVQRMAGERAFWAAVGDEEPVLVVADRQIDLQPGTVVTVTGRVEAAPPADVARRAWGVDEATALAVRERGVYVRASEITPP